MIDILPAVRRAGLFVFPVLLCCCAQSEPPPPPPPAVDPAPDAPWSSAPLESAAVPAVFAEQWNKAENRSTCGLYAFGPLGPDSAAVPRPATFSGGWAVAYDLPQSRSAFGVAGTGSSASDTTYSWPFNRQWSDGSNAGYGPEGGTGPNQLAYLRIAGEGCLYNVWSRRSREHLEFLLQALRRVDMQRD